MASWLWCTPHHTALSTAEGGVVPKPVGRSLGVAGDGVAPTQLAVPMAVVPTHEG